MKSVRLEPELEARLKRAAALIGSTESEVIRTAVGQQVDAILGRRVAESWAPFVGQVDSGGNGSARDAHKRFGELLRRDHDARAEKRAQS